MVLAILDGRKTQTRRIYGLCDYNKNPDLFGVGNVRLNGYFNFYRLKDEKGTWAEPKYKTGEILWVKETFQKLESVKHKEIDFLYKADVECNNYFNSDLVVWSSSIHMPQEAARIFLKVTNVRVERLQDISIEDIIGEGIFVDEDQLPKRTKWTPELVLERALKKQWIKLWQSKNAKHPWESNPWVWVYDFERVEKPENFLP